MEEESKMNLTLQDEAHIHLEDTSSFAGMRRHFGEVAVF